MRLNKQEMNYPTDAVVRCIWCDSSELIVFSENIFKCVACGKLTDDDNELRFERIKQRQVRDD